MDKTATGDQHGNPARVESLQIPAYPHLRDARLLTRLTGNGNYTWIELVGQRQPILVSQTLKYFERQLPAFIRVSKSVLLNPGWIIGSVQHDAKTLYLCLADGSSLLVSRRRTRMVIAKLSCPGSVTETDFTVHDRH